MREDVQTIASEPSARAWLAALADGSCSARELAERTLARIDTADRTVHAVVLRDDEAVLDAADAADAARRGGDERPLLGLPITVKDVLDVRGWRTAAGSLARTTHRASADATVVGRLRAAGAIPVAKTNAPECSCSFETDNLIFGRTEHPLDAARTPGGSSGGEAALLGADASIVGIGTDGGGSIRVPSHYCGTVGLRPTTGRTPETGLWPPTRGGGTMDFTCVGPMARHVEDLALLLPVIAGADGIDPYAVDVPLRDPADLGRRRLRIGFYSDHPRVPMTSPGVRAAVHAAAEAFAAAGHDVEEIAPPDGAIGDDGEPSATELFFAAAGADGGEGLRAAVAGAHGRHHPQFAAIIAAPDGPPTTAAQYLATQRLIHAYRARVRSAAADYDVLLSPVVSGPAPAHGQAPAGLPEAAYLKYEGFEYCHINAVAGLPAASVPVSVEEGLPVGVQIAAPAFREDLVLAAAAILEQATGGFAINRALARCARRRGQDGAR
ncbi:MAG: Amidase [Solirubrobacterales bacterium]|nr:Amidase [Solirubrobacterales bacterium]